MEDWTKRDSQTERASRDEKERRENELVTMGRERKGREGGGECARKGRTGCEQSGCQATDIVPIVAGVA